MNKLILKAAALLLSVFAVYAVSDVVFAAPSLKNVATPPAYNGAYTGISGGPWEMDWSDRKLDVGSQNWWTTVQVTEPADIFIKPDGAARWKETEVDGNRVFSLKATWKGTTEQDGDKVLVKFGGDVIQEVESSQGSGNPATIYDDWTGLTSINILARGSYGGKQRDPGGWFLGLRTKYTAESAETIKGKWGDYYFKASIGSKLSPTAWQWLTITKDLFKSSTSAFVVDPAQDVFADVYTLEFRSDYDKAPDDAPAADSEDWLQVAAVVLVGSKTSVGASSFTVADFTAATTGLPEMEDTGISHPGKADLNAVDFSMSGKASIYDLKGNLIKTISDLSKVREMATGIYMVKIRQNGKNFESLYSSVR